MKVEGLFDIILLGCDSSLEQFAKDAALAAALAGGAKENVLKELKRFYDASPGIYSVQWIDTNGINRFGYPEENSLPAGYDYNLKADIDDSKFLAILAKRQPAVL